MNAPLLPLGVRHYQTSGFARTRAAYDALTAADGWVEEGSELAFWKTRELPEGRTVVFEPIDKERS